MKKSLIQIFSLVGLVFGLMFSAQAQNVNQYTASIPFDFNVGNKTFAAGEYAFRLTNPLAYQETLTIRDLKSGKSQVVLITRRPEYKVSEISRLLFNRYEDRYYLASMVTETLNVKFFKAKTETRLAESKAARRESVAMKK